MKNVFIILFLLFAIATCITNICTIKRIQDKERVLEQKIHRLESIEIDQLSMETGVIDSLKSDETYDQARDRILKKLKTKIILINNDNEEFKKKLKEAVSNGWKVRKVKIAGAGTNLSTRFMYFSLLTRKPKLGHNTPLISTDPNETSKETKPNSERRFKLIGKHPDATSFVNKVPLGTIIKHDWGAYYKREDINTVSRWELVSQILRFPQVWEEI